MRWLNRPRKFICATEISSDLMWVVIGVSASNDIVMFESGDGICISSSENYSGPGKPHNMHSQDCRGARGSLEYSRGVMNRVTLDWEQSDSSDSEARVIDGVIISYQEEPPTDCG